MKWTRKVEKNEKAFLRRAHKRKDLRIAAALAAGFFGWGAASQAVFAAVTVEYSEYAGTVTRNGNVYTITNQQVKGENALNYFKDFNISQNEIANLQLGEAARQINIVKSKAQIDGIVNALKNGEIGGDVFFLSSKGIAVGETGRINAGNLYLGTNRNDIEEQIWSKEKDFSKMTMKDKLILLGGAVAFDEETKIDIQGKLQAAGEVLIGASEGITVGEKASIVSGVDFAKNTEHKSAKPDANWTAADYREKFMNMDGVEDAKTVVETKDGGIGLYSEDGAVTFSGTAAAHGGEFMMETEEALTFAGKAATHGGAVTLTAEKALTVSGTVESHGGAITMSTKDNELGIVGTADKKAKLISGGGDIRLTVNSNTADGQADKAAPEKGNGELRITHAYIDSTTADATKASGDIAIQSIRTAMGVSRVDISDSTINAKGTGTQAGDVTIHATAQTNLASWDIGDGAYAVVDVQDSKITGDNVDLAARATTTGDYGGTLESTGKESLTDEQIKAGIDEKGGFFDTLGDTLSNIRPALSITKTHTEANVNVKNSKLSAVGGTKAKEVKEGETAVHGGLSLTSNARGEIYTLTPAVTVGLNVGISDVESKVNITGNSALYSAGDTTIDAKGYNRVDLALLNLNVLDFKTHTNINLSWAQLTTDVEAKIDKGSTVTAKGNVGVDATSTRYLYSSAQGYGNAEYVGVAVSVAKSHTDAKALVEGDIYAGGDVSVKADNTLDKPNNVYQADTAFAISHIGDSNYTAVANTIGNLKLDLSSLYPEELLTDKIGANGAAALLFSTNTATANVSGKVRGVTAAGVGSDDLGAGSLLVDAHALSRTSTRASAITTFSTVSGGETKEKGTGSFGAIYASQKNTSTASVTGDAKTSKNTKADGTKTTGNVTINSKTEIPWQTKWAEVASLDYMRWLERIFTVATDNTMGLSDLVDGWAQSESAAEKATVAGTFTWMNYDNTSNAYIGENAKVESAGKVDIDAKNDITVVNFSGAVKNPLSNSTGIAGNIWSGSWMTQGNWLSDAYKSYYGTNSETTGIGGAILADDQINIANAYIAKGAVVKAAGDVTVDAKNEAMNLAIAMAGGTASENAFEGSITVDLIRDETNAYIDGTVETEGDAEVSATDDSLIVNIAGGVGVSTSKAIGAGVAYNHISRDTNANISGNVTAKKGNVSLDAKNTGSIVSVAAAGAVTAGTSEKDRRIKELNNQIENITNNRARNEVINRALNRNINLDQRLVDLNSQLEQTGIELDDETHLTASGTITVNRILDNADAYVARHVTVTLDKEGNEIRTIDGARPQIHAGALSITSNNDSYIFNASGALSLNFRPQGEDTALAGAVAYNSITAKNHAYVDSADLVLTGNTGKKKVLDKDGNVVKNEDGTDKEEEIDESLTVSATNDEQIINIGGTAAASVDGNGTKIAGQISMNWVDNTNGAYVKDSKVRADEAMNIFAADRERIDTYTGAVTVSSFSAGGKGVGAALTADVVEGKTDAYIKDSEVTGTESEGVYKRGGKVDVTAKDTGIVRSFAVGVGVADGTMEDFSTATVSAIVNVLKLATNAYIDTASAMHTGRVTIDGRNLTTVTLGAGAVAVSTNSGNAGGAIGVVVNNSTVNAYMKGDASKTNTIDASRIEVSADNTYNGSADKASSDSTAKTVAIGGSVSTGNGSGLASFGGAGSVTVNKITQTTKSYLGAGKYTADKGEVVIYANSTARLLGLAGGFSVSGGTGLGFAVDTQVYGGTTHAYIEDGAKLSNASNVRVQAESLEDMVSVAATIAATTSGDEGASGIGGGAGAAGAHSITTSTKAYIGNEEDKEKTAEGAAELSDVGNVSVLAKDTTNLSTGAGAGGASAGQVGVGLTAAVEVVNKTAMAFVGNHTKVGGTGLTVKAENISDSITATASLGFGNKTVGIAGSASETMAEHTTKAYVGKKAEVDAAGGDAKLEARSSFTQGSGAGGASAGGKGGVGLSNATAALKADTYAYVDDEAKLTAGSIDIFAHHLTDITYATLAGGVSNTGAVDGALGVNRLREKTYAYAGEKAQLTSEGDLSIRAEDETLLNGGTGGLSVSADKFGVGVAFTGNSVTKDTQAYAAREAKLSGAGDITIDAKNTEDIVTVTVQGALGSKFGLAGAMSYSLLDVVTKAYTDSAVQITQTKKDGAAKAGGIAVNATHEITKMNTGTAGGSFSAKASVGAAVDLALIYTQTNAYIGDGNTVKAAGDVTVKADENLDEIHSFVMSLSAAQFSLAGSFGIYDFNSDITDEDKARLEGTTEEGSTKKTTIDEWMNTLVDASSTAAAFDQYDDATLKSFGTKLKDEKKKNDVSTAPVTTTEKGTLAKIGASTTIEAGGDVTVDADGKIDMMSAPGTLAGAASHYAGSIGVTVSVVNMDSETKALVDDNAKIDAKGALTVDADALHELTSTVVGASVAIGIGAGVAATVGTWNDTSNVYALINDSKNTIRAGSISVTADNDHMLDSRAIGVAGSFVAAQGVVSTATVSGVSKAGIGSEEGTHTGDSTVTATDGDITVASNAKTKMTDIVTAPTAGVFAAEGSAYSLKSDVDAVSFIGAGEKLNAKHDINVTAAHALGLDASVGAVGVGAVAVGSTNGLLRSEDTAKVKIGDGASLAAEDGRIFIRSRTGKHDDKDYSLYGYVVSGGIAAGEIQVVIAQGDLDNETTTEVGKNVALSAGDTVEIRADHSDRGNLQNDTYAMTGIAGDGTDMRYTVDSDVTVTVGGGTKITSGNETKIKADNTSNKTWTDDKTNRKNVMSAGTEVTGGKGVVNRTTFTHTTKVDIGAAEIRAAAKELAAAEKAAGTSISDKYAITIDAASEILSEDYVYMGVTSIAGATHASHGTTATATTTVNVADGAKLYAGDTEKAKESTKLTGKELTDMAGTHGTELRGGSIGIGTKNSADIRGKAVVDTLGIMAYAGADNNVKYTSHANTNFGGYAETAKGDIRIAAGRDSSGVEGEVLVKAMTDLYTMTLVPLSFRFAPTATVESHAALDIRKAADIKSDRDIYLQSTSGDIGAVAFGNTRSWADELFSTVDTYGESDTSKSASTLTMEGSAETGIHRKQKITISGEHSVGKTEGDTTSYEWVPAITSSAGISYTLSAEKGVAESLYAQLQELEKLLDAYEADPAAKASYEAEIEFLRAKMVEQGYAYYAVIDTKDGKKITLFIPISSGGASDYANAQNTLLKMNDAAQSAAAAKGAQESALTAIGTAHDTWSAAAADLTAKTEAKNTALTEKNSADSAFTTAENAIKDKLADGQTITDYITAHESETEVTDYKSALSAKAQAQETYDSAVTAWDSAADAKTDAETAYGTAVTNYAKTYYGKTEGVSVDPSAYDTAKVTEENKAIEAHYSGFEKGYALQQGRVGATKAFQDAGGKDENGVFTLNGTALEGEKDAEGVLHYKYDYNGESYELYHFAEGGGMTTREVTVGDITAQLGDIYLEGDTVKGKGTMKAAGDASVTIENDSPYDVTVGGIRVAGKSSVNGLGQTTSMDGGSIIYTNTTTKESEGKSYRATASRTYTDAASLKETLTGLTGTISARNDGTQAAVTITNNFKPTAYKDAKNSPYYAAPTVTLGGSIYAPKGSVTVTSEAGDIASKGSIRAASVSLQAKNGDFIQSYGNTTGADQIFNAGGDPSKATYNKDTGAMTSTDQSTGILANGNIFISARYVNINSTIQSGVADYKLTIPEAPTLKDTDGNTLTIEEANARGTGIFTVTGAEGNAAENLTYDAENKCFVLSDISVAGGKIQIVGTVMNTSPYAESKGKILALDGYGNITIENKSSAGLELRNVNTGDGIEGKIEITDLDQKTGRITRKTTYTRDNGVIKTDVDTYTYDANGNATITKADTASSEKGAEQVIYKPASDLYYIWQTGQDSRTTTVYYYDDWDFDWWGIDKDEIPTGQDILDAGGTIISYVKGEEYDLPDGTTVGNKDDLWNNWGWWEKLTGQIVTDKYYTTGKKTFTTDKTSDLDWKERRNWYFLGLTKSYEITLTEKESKTTITQHAVKASQDIGIGFVGNEQRGELNISSDTGDVYIRGTVNNAGGSTVISSKTGNIIADENNFVDTKDLEINAARNAGGAPISTQTNDAAYTESAAIRTNAETLRGRVGGNLYVDVLDHGVALGDITAGETASVTAAGDITQAAGAVLTAKRAELHAVGGSITGAAEVTPGEGYAKVTNAFKVDLSEGQDYGADTGLMAEATGDISIYNASGDLYLDSAVSEAGNVTIISEGSILDNNYTDVDNETAVEKLTRWAEDAVLEGATETVEKQKGHLKAAVTRKYNRYLYLAQSIDEDGKYQISDGEKDYLKQKGYDDTKIASYVDDCQKEYDELKTAGVGSWTQEGVTAYIEGIENSKDTTLYGNASLTKDQLSSDTYLTQDEKATILVGTARSAKDLLISFTSGEIKEGITDTKTTKKETPHASGKDVTLISMNGAIGSKNESQTIDLSTMEKIRNLTRHELAALAAAEKNDFQIDANDVVTITNVRSITADATGKLTMAALGGSLYMTSDGSLKAGSDLYAADEMRVKTDGDIKDVTLGSGGETILESAEGEIDVTLRGEGTVTARAAKDIDLDKEDGDLIINTVYAAGGNVDINVTEGGIYADTRETSDFTNIEGEQITLTAKTAIGGARTTEEGTVTTPSIGLKATGAEAAEGETAKAANIKAEAGTSADILNTGTADKLEASATAGDLSLRNAGTIKSGEVKAEKGDLTVTNEEKATISGGTYTGKTLGVSNAGEITGGTFTATDALEVGNTGEIYDADFSGKTVTITNAADAGLSVGTVTATDKLTLNNAGDVIEGSYSAKDIEITSSGEDASISDASFEATDTLTVTNEGTVTGGTYTAGGAASLTNKGTWAKDTPEEGEEETEAPTLSGKSVTIHNEGTITDGDFTATAGNLTFTDTKAAQTSGNINFTARSAEEGEEAASGNISIEALGTLRLASVNADRKVTVNSAQSVTIGTLDAASAEIKATGDGSDISITNSNIEGTYKVDAKGDASVGTVTAAAADIDAGGDVTGTSITTTKDGADIDAGGIVNIATISAAGQAVDIDSVGDTTVGTITAKSADLKTTGDGADISVTNATVEDLYKIDAKGDAEIGTTEAGTADIDAGGNVTGTSLTTKKGGADIDAGGMVLIDTITAEGQKVDIDSVGKTEIESLKAGSADLKTSGAEGDIKVDAAEVAGELKVDAKHDADLGTVTAGSANISAGNKVSADSLETTTGDATITAKAIDITKADIEKALTVNATNDAKFGELEAGSASITAGNDATITKATVDGALTVNATHDATVTEAKAGSANITGGNDANVSKLETTTGDASITATKGNATTGTIISAANAAITATKGSVTNEYLKAAGDATITAGTDITVTKADVEGALTAGAGHDAKFGELEAGSASITAGNDATITKATVDGALTVNATHDATVKEAKAGSASITAGNDANVSKLETTTGNASITATKGNATTGTIISAADATISAAGNVTNEKLKATGDATITAGTDITVTKAEVEGTLNVNATNDATVTDAKAGSASITAGNDANVSKLETTTGDATITATKGDATTGTIISAADASISAAGNVTNEKLKATGDATITATTGSVTSGNITSGGDTGITAGTDIDIKKADVEGALTAGAGHDAKFGELEAGSAAITAGNDISVTKADVEGTITAEADQDIVIKALEAAEANLNADRDLKIGDADITNTFKGTAGQDADIDDLTAKDAEITSGRDTILTTTDIENTLKVISGKDIKVESKDTVAPTIKAGTIDMKADGDILVTTKDPTQKLEGVDTDAKAGAALDTTKSLPNASAKGNDYDVSKKGTATLESTKGEISAEAGGTVAADTVKTKDGEISIRGNAIGIDDLQNTGDTGVEVKIDGSTKGNDPAYYAGIHSSSKTPVEITDSRIEHLDFTGNDKIGIKDSRLSGTGSMATDKVTVELGKNLDGTAGWPIGRIFIDGMNIESTEPFGRNSGGTTINGERFPETAERVVNRALYSDNYAGRDGEEAEEDSEKKADDTITFSEVRAYEQYRALSM